VGSRTTGTATCLHRATPRLTTSTPARCCGRKDVADRLEVDPLSVRRAISRGDLPASRGCGIRVLAGDAAAWWRARSVAPPAPPEGNKIEALRRGTFPCFQRSSESTLAVATTLLQA
jgi:hypothetical protein